MQFQVNWTQNAPTANRYSSALSCMDKMDLKEGKNYTFKGEKS